MPKATPVASLARDATGAHTGAVNTETTPYVGYNYYTQTVDGTYNKGMRLKSVRYPDSGAEPDSRLVHYRYGAEGSRDEMISRVKTIHDDGTGESTGLPGQTLADYAYNGLGRMASEHFPQPDVKLDYFQGASGTYAGFDRFGRVKDQKWIKSTTVKDRYQYGYDYNSNRPYRKNTLTTGKDWAYTHDGLDRLATAHRGVLDDPPTEGLLSKNFRHEWDLDPVGNWAGFNEGTGDTWTLEQTRDNNKANEIDGIGQGGGQTEWVVPEYDARGNMATGPQPGSETSQLDFTYDAWNRLVKVVDNATSNVLGEYRYDGLNRRIRKYTEPAEDDWTVREYYYNTSWQVLEVRKEVKSRESGEPALAEMLYEQYVWSARYIDALVLRDRDSSETPDGVLDECLYYATDANMNVTALVSDGGTVVERYVYDPYGRVTFLDGDWDLVNGGTASDYDNEILYCGCRYDPESNLYHVRNRYYHPTLGRWITRDPIDYPDGMSLYEYVRSGPMESADPMGTQQVKMTLIGPQASIGFEAPAKTDDYYVKADISQFLVHAQGGFTYPMFALGEMYHVKYTLSGAVLRHKYYIQEASHLAGFYGADNKLLAELTTESFDFGKIIPIPPLNKKAELSDTVLTTTLHGQIMEFVNGRLQGGKKVCYIDSIADYYMTFHDEVPWIRGAEGKRRHDPKVLGQIYGYQQVDYDAFRQKPSIKKHGHAITPADKPASAPGKGAFHTVRVFTDIGKGTFMMTSKWMLPPSTTTDQHFDASGKYRW